MKQETNSPSIRAIFGRNLRLLTNEYASVAETCRQLDINRAQYNRYLNGESYPRPDILNRICTFFGTDARILTEPLEHIRGEKADILNHPQISEFTALGEAQLPEDQFPSGLFRFTRQSFLYPEKFIIGLLIVYREDGIAFIKGYESRQSVREQGLPQDPKTRQFKGYALQYEGGIGAMISRRSGMTCTFNFLTPVASFNRNFWQGYAVRTINEAFETSRITRMVYEFLGSNRSEIISTARMSGFCSEADLPPFHKHLLRIGEPFR